MSQNHSIQPDPPDDPIYLTAKREALTVFLAFLVAGVYTVLYCYSCGYDLDPATLKTVWGIPSWVVWGIIVPWMGAIGFSVWFSLAFIKDEELGEEREDAPRD